MNIGIIGGGQLGMMMAEAAHKLEYKTIGLDPIVRCPLSYVADEMIVADYNNREAFLELVKKVDVLTYEFENVDEQLIKEFEHLIPQKLLALTTSKHRLIEKEFAKTLNIPTPKFRSFSLKKDVSFPIIIKTTMGGYDGKGQYVVQTKEELEKMIFSDDVDYIMEEYITFDYEISVIATRGINGDIVYFPIPVNTHRNGILSVSDITTPVPRRISSKAKKYTKQILVALDYVGTLAVEFFVKGDTVLFNEFAPRPHNSGHYTIEGCNVSQFHNHILAITNQKLVQPKLLYPTIMVNELGQDTTYLNRMNTEICTYHNYHKTPRKDNRKMAHITCAYPDKVVLDDTVRYMTCEHYE